LENNVGKKLITPREEYPIKMVSGKAYAMKKYARNKALRISYNDIWGKIKE